MTTSDAKATSFSSGEEDFPLHFSEWLKRRRQALDLTQEQLAQRAQRLTEERSGLQPADATRMAQLRSEIAALGTELQELARTLAVQEEELPRAEQALRERNAGQEAASQRLAGVEARRHALFQLQEQIDRGAHTESWLETRGLKGAPRLWQGIRIEKGWEDALERRSSRTNARSASRMRGISPTSFRCSTSSKASRSW